VFTCQEELQRQRGFVMRKPMGSTIERLFPDVPAIVLVDVGDTFAIWRPSRTS
jgi:hypothetical protein